MYLSSKNELCDFRKTHKATRFNFNTLLIVIFLMVSSISYATLPSESSFYTKTPTVKTIKFTINSPWDNSGNDSPDLQKIIDDNYDLVSGNKKGVTILIPNGKYFFENIQMKSNVHILVNENSIIYLANGYSNIDKNKHIFRFGPDNQPQVENASISCMTSGSKFIINVAQLNSSKKIMPITLSNVKHFRIRGIRILEKRSQFQGIDLSPAKKIGGGYARPENGIVQEIEINNADYGYGLVQMHCGKNIYFKDLFGVGGTTLRLESDYRDGADEAQTLVIEDVYARDITCKYGNSTVTLSPHERYNLKVDIDRVKAVECGWAVRIEDSYSSNTSHRLGRFASNSKIRNVTTKYGNNARVKINHINKYTCNDEDYTLENNNLLPANNTLGYKGPSVAGALYEASYSIDFNPTNHVSVLSGSISGPLKVLTGKLNCTSNKIISSKETEKESNIHSFNLYPNPAENKITIESKETQTFIEIYDATNRKVLNFKPINTNVNILDTSHFSSGVYWVKLKTPEKVHKLCFIVK